MEKATSLTHYEQALQKKLEELGYSVNVYDEPVSRYNKYPRRYAEIEKYTNNGVDQIITLEPFNVESFEDYVNNYDVDEEIDLHRQGESFRNAFSIRQALEDFEDWQETIENDLNELSEFQDDYEYEFDEDEEECDDDTDTND